MKYVTDGLLLRELMSDPLLEVSYFLKNISVIFLGENLFLSYPSLFGDVSVN